MNKANRTRLIVTRVFDSGRTPQDAFVRVILNSEVNVGKSEKCLQVPEGEGIIGDGGLIYVQPDSEEEGRNR